MAEETIPENKTEKPKEEASKPVKKGKGKKPPAKRPPAKKQKTTSQMLVSLLIKIGVVAAVVFLTFKFVLGFTVYYGNNMHPAVRDGDLIVSLRLQSPYLNAAVMYEHDGETKIGRVVALEGDTVDITDKGELMVNGNIPSEEVFYPTYKAENSGIKFPYTVESGKVFILNDFRNDTKDSRSFGTVDKSDLKGPLLLTMRRRGF